MTKADFGPMPPEKAVKWFKSKGYALGFDWRDIWQEEHAIAFTVAKAASIDLLQDIRNEVEKALVNGETFESFKQNLKPKLVERGWWGRANMQDPLTGEVKEVQLGSTRRLKTIYRTNIDMAYAAGRWEEIEATRKTHPYLRYRCSMLETSRESHKSWDGIVLPVDDPWWDSHYPPCAWNCKCWVEQVLKSDVDKGLVKVSPRPRTNYVAYKNKRTGQTIAVPEGISPGFDYNVGKARARAFTPPPLGGLPETVQVSSQLPPLPKPSPLPKNAVLPTDLPDEDYINAFLKIFNGKIGKTVYFEDKIGDTMPINKDLFLDRRNHTWKANKQGRGQYMPLLAMGLQDPDEIWLQWVQNKSGKWNLKKRYIKIWQEKRGSHCFTVFDWMEDGWRGTTTFPVKDDLDTDARDKYIAQFRAGLLLYQKGSE